MARYCLGLEYGDTTLIRVHKPITVIPGRCLDIYVAVKHADGKCAFVKDLVMEELPEDHDVAEPSFRVTPLEAQALMDNLWDCGLRPTEGSGSAGAMAATQRHLEDMRKIVFAKLGLK